MHAQGAWVACRSPAPSDHCCLGAFALMVCLEILSKQSLCGGSVTSVPCPGGGGAFSLEKSSKHRCAGAAAARSGPNARRGRWHAWDGQHQLLFRLWPWRSVRPALVVPAWSCHSAPHQHHWYEWCHQSQQQQLCAVRGTACSGCLKALALGSVLAAMEAPCALPA